MISNESRQGKKKEVPISLLKWIDIKAIEKRKTPLFLLAWDDYLYTREN